MLTQAELKSFVKYNSKTGIFTWLNPLSNRVKVGDVVGFKSNLYLATSILAKRHYLHRLAWLYMYGENPPQFIDHINGIRSDNRILNLRLASNLENNQNQKYPQSHNTSGFRGVHVRKDVVINKYGAKIKFKGKVTYLGHYKTLEEAYEVYLQAKRKLHPFNTL